MRLRAVRCSVRLTGEGILVRLKLIGCEILYREVCAVAARAAHIVDLEFLPKGLHDMGRDGMQQRLQETIAAVDAERYDAVVLGYALCNNGIVGLRAGAIPLVAPRAHDCITLFLGSKERYAEFFRANPGAYYKTTGWIERGEGLDQQGTESIARRLGLLQSMDDLIARYGEENARYIRQQLGDLTRNYSKLVFIETGIEPDDRYLRHTQGLAEGKGWEFTKLTGDLSLLQALVDGKWDPERFLVVSPGQEIAAVYTDAIIGVQDLLSQPL